LRLVTFCSSPPPPDSTTSAASIALRTRARSMRGVASTPYARAVAAGSPDSTSTAHAGQRARRRSTMICKSASSPRLPNP
jgi:hypothetical protein